MDRRAALQAVTDFAKNDGVLSVATMRAVPVWHDLAPQLPLHIDMLGCMGSASSLGLGLAIGAPDRQVIVVDGDGCLMMQLGTLVTIGSCRPSNLTIVIMNNGTYETSGNQPIPGAESADIPGLARSAGFVRAVRITTPTELTAQLAALADRRGPNMLVLDIDSLPPDPDGPSLSMSHQFQTVRRLLSPS